MGTIKQGIFGEFTGKVGNVVGYKNNGRNYVRSVPGKVRNPRSKAQQGQRKKFAAVFAFLQPISDFVRAGYALYGKEKAPFHAAMSYLLKKAVHIEGDEAYIDYHRALVSTGTLMTVPEAKATVEAGKIRFGWKNNSGEGNAEATDAVWLLAYNADNGEATYRTQAAQRDDGQAELSIPERWAGQHVVAYLCLCNEAEGLMSNSLCVAE